MPSPFFLHVTPLHFFAGSWSSNPGKVESVNVAHILAIQDFSYYVEGFGTYVNWRGKRKLRAEKINVVGARIFLTGENSIVCAESREFLMEELK